MTQQQSNLGYIMGAAVENHPQRAALIDLSTTPPIELSYAQLDKELDAVATGALVQGLVAGDVVAIVLENRWELVALTFGLMRAGIVPTLLNPRLHAPDFEFLLADCGCQAVVISAVSAAALSESPNLPALRIGVDDIAAQGWLPYTDFKKASVGPVEIDLAPQAVALQLYTSGSTGRPKGVLMGHSGVTEHFLDQIEYYEKIHIAPVVNLVATPMFHKNGTGMTKTNFILQGTMVILPRFQPVEFLQAIAAYKVTMFAAVATMLAMMLRERETIEKLDLSSLEAIYCGAAPSGRLLLDEVAEVFGTRLFHMYGATELGTALGHPPGEITSLDSCGRPVPGVTVKLIADDGSEGEEGEAWVASPGLALGYRNRKAATDERFQNGWYRTGDILWRDADGNYFFRGRTDDMFVCGGENIYPLEVERVLCRHPGVAAACVVPMAHPLKGQAPVAAITLKPDVSLSAEEITTYYVDNAPAYGHPRLVHFVDQLPIAPTGKIDRMAVSAQLKPLAATAFGVSV